MELGPGLNLFHGDNAQGKTNLLEAVCLLASLRSFRGVKSGSAIAWGERECLVSGEAEKSADRRGRATGTNRLRLAVEKDARRVLLDGKRPKSAADYLLAVRVITFSPEDLFLAREYPSARRRFLDRSVFHLSPAYLGLANRCRAAIRQLNAAMKTGDAAQVRTWEELAAPLFAEISAKRRERADELASRASDVFGGALGSGRPGLAYKCHAKGGGVSELTGSYRALMEKKRPEGMRRGYCLVGPHTDDLAVTVDGHEMRGSASRGQGKLALLALALADAELYFERKGERPVLLLDDVGAELDGKRRGALTERLTGMGQALITSTDPDVLDGRKAARFKVECDADGARMARTG